MLYLQRTGLCTIWESGWLAFPKKTRKVEKQPREAFGLTKKRSIKIVLDRVLSIHFVNRPLVIANTAASIGGARFRIQHRGDDGG